LRLKRVLPDPGFCPRPVHPEGKTIKGSHSDVSKNNIRNHCVEFL
jgi:hypothetical protein